MSNRHLFSHSSGNRKPAIGITGPKSRWAPSTEVLGENLPCLLQRLGATSLPCLVATSLPSLPPFVWPSLLSLTRTLIGFRAHANPEGSCVGILYLVTSAKTFQMRFCLQDAGHGPASGGEAGATTHPPQQLRPTDSSTEAASRWGQPSAWGPRRPALCPLSCWASPRPPHTWLCAPLAPDTDVTITTEPAGAIAGKPSQRSARHAHPPNQPPSGDGRRQKWKTTKITRPRGIL